MSTVTIVHHDEGKRLDGEANGVRVYSAFCEHLQLSPDYADEPQVRRIAQRAYEGLSAPKKLIERNNDTGSETDIFTSE